MGKTFIEALEELNRLYDEIISLMPYQNDPEVSKKMRDLRSKTTLIESVIVSI